MSIRKLTQQVIGNNIVFLPIQGRSSWKFDAGTDQIVSPIVVPSEWASVFSNEADPFGEQLSVFIGPKGVGKSTLLHLKRAIIEGSVQGIAAHKGTICLPISDDFLAFGAGRGQKLHIRWDSPEGHVFSEQSAWISLWRTLLAVLVLQADFDRKTKNFEQISKADSQASPTRENIDPKHESLQRALDLFGRTGQNIEPTDIIRCLNAAIAKKGICETLLTEIYEQDLLPAIRQNLVTKKYCLFIDAVDEHLRGDDGSYIDVINSGWLRTIPDTNDSSVTDRVKSSYNIWANTQAGLVLASMDIFADSNKRIRVYAPIRSEAYHAAASTVAETQLTTCAHVTYSREALETIIKLNMAIDLEVVSNEKMFTDDGKISEANYSRIEQLFFGGRTQYTTYGNISRRWVAEIVRFSMERPREVMMIGRKIRRASKPNLSRMSPNEILFELQSALADVLNQFLQFIVGEKVEKHLKAKVFPYLPSNVLSYDELTFIQNKATLNGVLMDHPLCKLYSLGLLGDVKRPAETQESIQRFAYRQAGVTSLRLPSDAMFFVLHPMVTNAMSTIVDRPSNLEMQHFNLNEQCPIGNELPWNSAPAERAVSLQLRRMPEVSTITIDAVTFNPGGRSSHSKASLKEERVTKSQTRSNILFIAWLYTIYKKEQDAVLLDDVIDSIEDLVNAKVFKSRLNVGAPKEQNDQGRAVNTKPTKKRKKTQITKATREVMMELLDGASDSHYVFSDIRKFLQNVFRIDDVFRCEVTADSQTALLSPVITKSTVQVSKLPIDMKD